MSTDYHDASPGHDPDDKYCICRPCLKKATLGPDLLKFSKDFQQKVKAPSKDAHQINKEAVFGRLVQEITEWIAANREALLLAWFAQYGFEPGKAVLVESHENGQTKLYIREATEEEKNQRRRD